jgi:hypothetical protein
MEDINSTHKTKFLDNLLQQNLNTGHILPKISKTPSKLHSTHTHKLKLKMSSPHTREKPAPDM